MERSYWYNRASQNDDGQAKWDVGDRSLAANIGSTRSINEFRIPHIPNLVGWVHVVAWQVGIAIRSPLASPPSPVGLWNIQRTDKD